MSRTTLTGTNHTATVLLKSNAREIRIAARLVEDFVGGSLIRFANPSDVHIEGIDALSSTYKLSNWTSGLASGAHYAFRALQIPRQHLEIASLEASLSSEDMEALANAAALSVCALTGNPAVRLNLEGWSPIVETHDDD